jgi:hypothetical protein
MATSAFSDTPNWPEIQRSLDAVPVFTVANEDGKPLQYEVGGQPMAMFYADVLAAKTELEAASGQYPDLKCDLIPVGLGAAYKLACDGQASLVPGVAELKTAGMPEGMSAIGQELPLFACMQMRRQTEEGGTIVPLFLSFDDCDAAVKEVREAAEAENADLEIIGLSLPSVVEHLASIADGKPEFAFVAPTSSTHHINSYVGSVDGKSVYARVIDVDPEE